MSPASVSPETVSSTPSTITGPAKSTMSPSSISPSTMSNSRSGEGSSSTVSADFASRSRKTGTSTVSVEAVVSADGSGRSGDDGTVGAHGDAAGGDVGGWVPAMSAPDSNVAGGSHGDGGAEEDENERVHVAVDYSGV